MSKANKITNAHNYELIILITSYLSDKSLKLIFEFALDSDVAISNAQQAGQRIMSLLDASFANTVWRNIFKEKWKFFGNPENYQTIDWKLLYMRRDASGWKNYAYENEELRGRTFIVVNVF